MIVRGEMLVEGTAEGAVFALTEPLSFWGGFDSVTGNVIDHRHPDLGQCLTGRIVVVAAARGSSSGSSVLAEAIRSKTAPAGFVIASRDAILTVGAQVAAELYAIHCPIVCVSTQDFARLAMPGRMTITATSAGAELVHSPAA